MSLRAVVIGASAGGVQALSHVLPDLPADFPAPVLVVVHIPPRKDNALVEYLLSVCPPPLRLFSKNVSSHVILQNVLEIIFLK